MADIQLRPRRSISNSQGVYRVNSLQSSATLPRPNRNNASGNIASLPDWCQPRWCQRSVILKARGVHPPKSHDATFLLPFLPLPPLLPSLPFPSPLLHLPSSSPFPSFPLPFLPPHSSSPFSSFSLSPFSSLPSTPPFSLLFPPFPAPVLPFPSLRSRTP